METSELPTAEQPTPAPAGRRAPVSKKRRRRAQCRLSKLTLLQEEYPERSRQVQTAADRGGRHPLPAGAHQGGGDREAVLRVLEEWDATGLVVEGLVEEVEYLSRWDVGEALKEIGHLIEYRDEYRPADARGGAPRQIIRLRRGARGGWRGSDAQAGAAAGGRGGGGPGARLRRVRAGVSAVACRPFLDGASAATN